MIMSNADIVREYKAAKTPMKQIGILADQNLCKKKEIVEILLKEGCEVPKYYTKQKEKDDAQDVTDINVGNMEQETVAADINVGTKEPESVAEAAETVAGEPESVAEDPDGFRLFEEPVPERKELPKANEQTDLEKKLLGVVKAISDHGFELRKDAKKIKALTNGILQLLQIYADVDLSTDGYNSIVKAVKSFTEEINVFLFTMDLEQDAVDKIVIDALVQKPVGGE